MKRSYWYGLWLFLYLLCAGLGILLLLLSNLSAKGLVKLTKLVWDACKGIFKRKEQTV